VKKANFWKTKIFYNFSLAHGIIAGVLLERHLFGQAKEGLLWRLYDFL